MTELPTFMKQVLHFDIKSVSKKKNKFPSLFFHLLLKIIFFNVEWNIIIIAIFSYVVILNGSKSCRRLDDNQWAIHTYSN